MLEETLKRDSRYEVLGFGRESLELTPRPLDLIGSRLSTLLGFETDYVINCMGATKPMFVDVSDLSTPIYVNAIFPHQLATWGELTSTKVIHITTDCVYDGILGRYDERAPASAIDHYGQSKSLGEPDNCMVIRTSVIGPEFGGRKRHFLSWIKSMDGKSVDGFTNHFWNGLTTIELSRVIADIMRLDLWSPETYHIHSNDVSKYEMVDTIAKVYGLNIDLTATKTKYSCDRRLRSILGMNFMVEPAPFRHMIEDMFEYEQKKEA
jgi:dTDP-4-dehydrorhamnose reductase